MNKIVFHEQAAKGESLSTVMPRKSVVQPVAGGWLVDRFAGNIGYRPMKYAQKPDAIRAAKAWCGLEVQG